MPELPEVETVIRDLESAGVPGATIAAAQVLWSKTVATPEIPLFCKEMAGKTICAITRRAKWLVWTLSSGYTLFIHLRMTGRFSFTSGPHARLILTLNDGRKLYFHDPRKFGRWALVHDAAAFTRKLGPEPLDKTFGEADFLCRLHAKKRQSKPLLLDQSFLAGLGNIYVDEALFEAQLHPQMLAHKVSKQKAAALLKAIRHVLWKGITAQGTSLGQGKSNFYRLDGSQGSHQETMQVFRRTGLPCPRCGAPIKRILVGQRSTHFCPKCQKL